ncbi:MAG: type II secretion system F family protein [Gammaproteobacteria bacterium]|nr:MAG: type II secretion system F family protein [Gammaproteobacteria bacterium]
MATYLYKAIDANGKRIKGQLEANNPQDVELRLQKMDLEPIVYKPVNTAKISFIKSRVTRKDLIAFTFHMEQLIKAGVPILETLTDLRDSLPQNSGLKPVATGLIEEIEGGKNFSGALENFPKIFNKIYISTVKVGEESGNLHHVLFELAEMLKWQEKIAAQAKKMMMYPIIAGTVISGVVLFLMIYLVPQLVTFLKSTGNEIPPATQALIATSDFISTYWYIIIPTPIVLAIALKISHSRSEYMRYVIDDAILHLPLFGSLTHKLKIARFTKYFALMYESGITVLDTLNMSKSVVNNVVIEQSIERARNQISQGETISNSFKNVGMFPPFVTRMMGIGETGGSLDTALNNVCEFYTREANDTIDKIEPMIVPILTVVLASILGWIMYAVIGPIYDVISKLS